jgi:DNA-binding response OmpR family regulator
MIGKRVLVVDDDTLLVKSIQMCLSKRGHDVTGLFSGVDAVKYLFEQRPDLLVLDIRLPDCDGWFLAKLLNKLELAGTVPLILISAMEPDRGKIAEAKPFAYIQKPFDMGHLLQVIEKSLVEADGPAGEIHPAG